MVVAETRGLLRPLQSEDRLGKIREVAILHQIRRELSAKAVELKYLREVSSAQYVYGDSEAKIYKFHSDEATAQFLRWLGCVEPYVDWESRIKQLEEDNLKRDVASWESEFGSLEDPDVLEENKRLAEWLKAPTVRDEYDREM